ncbi:AmmeMemoRadiSam system protein B [Neptuniibacter sp. QD48_55]|uniref:AmmeMemoRadiSam system protein B n=1 Tax=Neptuniibacter sp. QD48_55 TaxID=3398212 RepID=UPI0039F5DCB5
MNTRQPAVSGLFYPDDARELACEVDTLLRQEQREVVPNLRALIVPHAGYIYSGSVAAAAYSCIPQDALFKYILLIGPSHRVAFQGMAVPLADQFNTPLGNIAIATDRVSELVDKGLVRYNDLAHRQEHSLEVQLPFIQQIDIQADLIPVVVGNATASEVGKIILPALQDSEVLTVISTDLSHYHSYVQAKLIDENTNKRIIDGDTDITGNEACGYMGLNGLLLALASTDLKPHLLQTSNSGDSAGDKARVVGYGAYAIY